MVWQQRASPAMSDTVIVSFKVQISQLPVDHIDLLSQLIVERVPYLADYPTTGIHTIHGAESGNGWARVEQNHDIMYPSRRCRLKLQVPATIAKQLQTDLSNFTADLYDQTLTLTEPKVSLISRCTTIFARYVVAINEDENTLLDTVIAELDGLNIQADKMVCGKSHTIKTRAGDFFTRSLLLVDCEIKDAVFLLANGIGNHKLLGCGLFFPHKEI